MHVPFEGDSEPEEVWEDVDEVRCGSVCGFDGDFARAKGQAETEAGETPKVWSQSN